MAEPTCDCGHSRFDHELGDYAERPGKCEGAWDCECPFYDGPDQDDEPDEPAAVGELVGRYEVREILASEIRAGDLIVRSGGIVSVEKASLHLDRPGDEHASYVYRTRHQPERSWHSTTAPHNKILRLTPIEDTPCPDR